MQIAYDSPQAKRIVGATVLGSAMVFLDSSVVTVALPVIESDLDAGLSGLQWTVDAYLLTLSALLLTGGALGDRYGRRRMFTVGVIAFAATSVLCGLAPSIELLVLARTLQGMAGAILTPGSLAIIAGTFEEPDRGRAIGTWASWVSVATLAGPFVGGWIADTGAWRLIFFINVPFALATLALTKGAIPEDEPTEAKPPDIIGALSVTMGLGLATFGLIRAGERGLQAGGVLPFIGAGAILLAFFVVWQLRSAHPMVPCSLFRSRTFTAINVVTFLVYAALQAAFFALSLHLQGRLGYSASETGLSLTIVSVLLVIGSPLAGRIAGKVGPRAPLTLGPALIATAIAVLGGVAPGDGYVLEVLPGLVLFGIGLTVTVAPLTAGVLGSVDKQQAGVASAINNAISRAAGLMAIALLPVLAGGAGRQAEGPLPVEQFASAMRWLSVACAAGAFVALVSLRGARAKPGVASAP